MTIAADNKIEAADILAEHSAAGAHTAITIATSITMADGATIGQAAGPLLTFDDTLNYLEITGCNVGIGTTAPEGILELKTSSGHALLYIDAADTPGIEFEAADVAQWEITAKGNLDFRKFVGGAAYVLSLTQSRNVGIGTISPDRLLHGETSDAVTNAVTYAQRLSHITSGTAVAGFGTGIEFELEENDTTNRVAAYITADWQDAGEGASADGRLNFGVMTADAAAATAMSIWNGIVFIGDDANAKMAQGLTISMGANDNEIVALKSSDVAHAMTDHTEADTFGVLKKGHATAGGLDLQGWRDADAEDYGAIKITGYQGEAANAVKGQAGHGIIRAITWVTDADTSIQLPAADANLMSIESGTETRFIFDEEGEMHSDDIIGVGDDWDDWDDLALAADLSRLPKARFSEMMRYKAEDFERAGLLTLSTDGDGTRHAFIRHKAMLQFYACCFAEVGERLRRHESALLSLGVQPDQLPAGVCR